MILPHSPAATLFLIIAGMICWGSWANTLLGLRPWRYELYYFDWSLGVLLAATVLALTAGSLGFDGFSFSDDFLIASKRQWLFGFVAGVIFNLGNLFFTAALSLAGMAVVYPIGFGSAIIVVAALTYFTGVGVNAAFLAAGAATVVAAIAAATIAYGRLLVWRHEMLAKAGKAKSTRRPGLGKGLLLAAAGGLLLAAWVPVAESARNGDLAPGPYSVAFIFAAGVFASTFLFNLFFMNLPVQGEPLEVPEYFRGRLRDHAMGMAGGVLWCAGLIAALVVTAAPPPNHAAPALCSAAAGGAGLIGALWGMVAWKDFRETDSYVTLPAALALVLFSAGVALLSIALLHR